MKKKLLSIGILSISFVLLLCACKDSSSETRGIQGSIETENIENGDASDNITEQVSTKEEADSNVEQTVEGDLIPMVMINGELYYATGKESTIDARCGMVDGEIASSVDAGKKPTEDNQSNFGAGYGYQFVSEGTIEIQMEDGKWYVYKKEGWEETMEEKPAFISVENPSWEYYIAESIQSGTKPYELKLIEESANEIIDTEEWFTEYGLVYGTTDVNEEYQCGVSFGSPVVNVYKEGEEYEELDFSEYMYSPDYVEKDKDFIEEEVHDAKIKDGILYVSTFHYTYAASAPSNAYITAINLENYSVIWKSQPLVCNSLNFEIVDDIIFCGYGFTEEDDYLYQLDRLTGCVLDTHKLLSKPDYIIYKEGKLYVRTYNTNYVFEVVL